MYEDQDIELSDQELDDDSEKAETPPLVQQNGRRAEARRYGRLKNLVAAILGIVLMAGLVFGVSRSVPYLDGHFRRAPNSALRGGSATHGPTSASQKTSRPETLSKSGKPALVHQPAATELPREVENAMALLEYYRRTYGDNIPAEDQPFARVAKRVLERYRQSTGGQMLEGPSGSQQTHRKP